MRGATGTAVPTLMAALGLRKSGSLSVESVEGDGLECPLVKLR
jgi:hypothetical protein